ADPFAERRLRAEELEPHPCSNDAERLGASRILLREKVAVGDGESPDVRQRAGRSGDRHVAATPFPPHFAGDEIERCDALYAADASKGEGIIERQVARYAAGKQAGTPADRLRASRQDDDEIGAQR